MKKTIQVREMREVEVCDRCERNPGSMSAKIEAHLLGAYEDCDRDDGASHIKKVFCTGCWRIVIDSMTRRTRKRRMKEVQGA